MKVTINTKLDNKGLHAYLEKLEEAVNLDILNKYGRKGVEELEKYTPKDTGETSKSWIYTIEKTRAGYTIVFDNTNRINETRIALLVQYGHATRNGGWVEGIDYINPAIQPVFQNMAEEIYNKLKSS